MTRAILHVHNTPIVATWKNSKHTSKVNIFKDLLGRVVGFYFKKDQFESLRFAISSATR